MNIMRNIGMAIACLIPAISLANVGSGISVSLNGGLSMYQGKRIDVTEFNKTIDSTNYLKLQDTTFYLSKDYGGSASISAGMMLIDLVLLEAELGYDMSLYQQSRRAPSFPIIADTSTSNAMTNTGSDVIALNKDLVMYKMPYGMLNIYVMRSVGMTNMVPFVGVGMGKGRLSLKFDDNMLEGTMYTVNDKGVLATATSKKQDLGKHLMDLELQNNKITLYNMSFGFGYKLDEMRTISAGYRYTWSKKDIEFTDDEAKNFTVSPTMNHTYAKHTALISLRYVPHWKTDVPKKSTVTHRQHDKVKKNVHHHEHEKKEPQKSKEHGHHGKNRHHHKG